MKIYFYGSSKKETKILTPEQEQAFKALRNYNDYLIRRKQLKNK